MEDATKLSETVLNEVGDSENVQQEAELNEGKMTTEKEENEVSEKTTTTASEAEQSEENPNKKETSTSDDQGEDHDDHDHEENIYDSVELDGASKSELLDWLKKISKEDQIRKIDKLYKDLGQHYQALYEEERKSALGEFLAIEGNEESDFDFKGEDLDRQFHDLHEALKHKRSHFFHQLEKQKEDNLARKTEILDLIRESVDGEDQTSFNKIKKLQEEWRKIGPVPGAQNRTLWANYHALMDRFYDQRSIYYELKELDRKKNLEAKQELCERAESLDPTTDLKTAIATLNELHEEFKHIGPVPKEDQEALWQRFKAASDHVYEHRKEYTEKQKEEHKLNLEKKTALAEKATIYSTFNSDRIKDWNSKTKELLELQKEWEKTGMVPRDKAKEVNKAFWGYFKSFFHNKNKFFKALDGEREENLKKKQELINQAAALKTSTDWEKTARDLKELQNKWRDIGPVPEKFRKSSFEEFKAHCDFFFEKRRENNSSQNQEFNQNLKQKQVILDALEELGKSNPMDIDAIFDKAEEFSKIGLVPRNAVAKILDRYDAIAKKITKHSELSPDDATDLRMHFDLCKIRNSPHGNQKINRKENALKRKISGLENDITNWKNNMAFFAESKNANQLKEEFNQKIVDAEAELEHLKQQLRLL